MTSAKGEDRPLKYPAIFNSADVAVLTNALSRAVVALDTPGID